MSRIVLLVVLILTMPVLTGCVDKKAFEEGVDSGQLENQAQKLTKNTEEKFALTTESQDAIFRIGMGWTGGMGGYPIFGRSEYRPVQYDNQAVYLDDGQAEELLADKLPSCVIGQPLVKISANISLEKITDTNYSIPPDDYGDFSEESYYSATINELHDILVLAEECQD